MNSESLLTRNSNTFHIRHIAAQFLTYLLNRMAANRFIYITQLRVIYRTFRNSFTQVARLQLCHKRFQQWHTSVREQIVTVLGSIGDNHVHFVQTLTGDGVGNQRQFVQ